ncbi:phage holin family protein [uncultured Desulfovibrio sp.]|uniref:phage holin family protein n=1 Tax=uncultured Desulfovibrio sp. TaxID=167968 RepID=UPI00272CABF4|nr:phage holin family protein [uncultured Desulfovibrio sp.]
MIHHVSPWEGIVYYSQNIASLWAEKAVFSTLITGFVSVFGGDALLIWFLCVMWFVDFLFGLMEALRRNRFRCRMLIRGVLKLPTYCLYLLLVGVVNMVITRSLGMEFPVLNLFIAYLVITDVVSIMGHMLHLGMPVPRLLRNIILKSQANIEHKVDQILDDDQEDRRQD